MSCGGVFCTIVDDIETLQTNSHQNVQPAKNTDQINKQAVVGCKHIKWFKTEVVFDVYDDNKTSMYLYIFLLGTYIAYLF